MDKYKVGDIIKINTPTRPIFIRIVKVEYEHYYYTNYDLEKSIIVYSKLIKDVDNLDYISLATEMDIILYA